VVGEALAYPGDAAPAEVILAPTPG
jgi:hypothetical protein